MMCMDHEEKFFCSACGKHKTRCEFRWRRINGVSYKAHCLDCTSQHRSKYHFENQEKAKSNHAALRVRKSSLSPEEQIEWWVSRHINQWRLKSTRKGLPVVDLDKEYVLGIYRSQKGLCYYGRTVLKLPKVGMKHAAFEPDLISLDRKTPSLGYTKGNVVLCSFLMNTTKGNRTEEEFLDMCKRLAEIHR